ncbi:hydrolase [Sphingopyxis granuli]|uniref:Glutamate carboxypeptidase n=1 Tax=Sphingopyxis granuli TaxID=267128 RepID=A0AA86GN02_9SPHN|nr:hydrolase [Sphingopyxis granuli]AMG75094.1 Glutamate carboxypeptidase [Sphingopyxis granuli]
MTALTASEMATLERAADTPMLAAVEAWAAVNSGTGNLAGLKTIAGMLADAFAVLPGTVRLVEPDPVESVDAAGQVQTIVRGDHLHVRVRPDAPVQLLLTGHMDTVFPADHPFQFLTWREPGVLNGPGTADMKGGIAVILAALTALEASPLAPRIGYDVMINSDEETGSHASAALIAELAKGKAAALTYEPALPDGTLAGARPGSGNFSVSIHGRSAHAGRNPEEGRNALIAAADLALRLNALKSPDLKVNPAKIDGGGPNNVVPDQAILRVNMRPATPAAMAAAEAALRDAMAAVAREHDVHCHLHGGFNRPPKPLDEPATRLFELVRDCGALLGIAIDWKATGGVCDGNNIAACGVPVVDTMGPRGGAIHSADEFLIVDSLPERARLSALTMLRLAERGTA